ncbi:hypothetical protein XM38_049570 [Halomicronema hongdechloris C2206]|uniref:Putative restriction endonuclease domain-containing protein n=1 Tax=Halomicronema hongdechloris C2206 TaxID=1641165 RepID=A0A1Z3HUL9_9CYAN|nr:Uma2 family endonuclease [Halomicronema hongdechloris]ASC73983.1 hypothetical protein XM38_049570 [Halomicronema hongdechloris C2206]
MYPTPMERFEDFTRHRPEGKLELIDGRLIVGNSLVGSRLLLRQILHGWKVDAAIALAPLDTWIQALAVGYDLTLPETGAVDEKLNSLEAQVCSVNFNPEDLQSACAEVTWSHHRLQQNLSMSLFRLAEEVGGQSFGRDFVMRLSNNGFTPDLLFFKGEGLNQLYGSFLSGPAELVVEVQIQGHEEVDRVTKRDYYQTAGVPEYWLIDPQTQRCEFYRLVEEQYQLQPIEDDGYYRPSSVPGLAFQADALWQEEEINPWASSLFIVEQRLEGFERLPAEEGPRWGSLLFIPNIQAEAVPISFEEYISWAPRAKFEFIQGKPLIGSTPGTRNVLAMLLMTFGLAGAVKLLPPYAWIQGLKQRLEGERQDAERKAEWWAIAREAAERLRTHFSIRRLGVIGDLAMAQPLNYWSDITLVYWEKLEDSWRAYDVLRDLDPDMRRIDLLQVDQNWLTADQLWQIERHLVEL